MWPFPFTAASPGVSTTPESGAAILTFTGSGLLNIIVSIMRMPSFAEILPKLGAIISLKTSGRGREES